MYICMYEFIIPGKKSASWQKTTQKCQKLVWYTYIYIILNFPFMFQVVLDVSDSILQDETVRRSLIPRTSNRWYNWVKKHHNCSVSFCLWFSWKLLKLLYYRVSHKSRRIAKILNMTFHINLPSFSSLSRSGIIFTFKKRASFMGNPVLINLLTVYQTVKSYVFLIKGYAADLILKIIYLNYHYQFVVKSVKLWFNYDSSSWNYQ